MATTPTLRSLAAEGVRRRLTAWASGALKADGGSGIWGGAFDAFMGIDRGATAGVREIGDQPADYAYARTAESYVFTCEGVRGRAISQVPLRCWETDTQGRRHAVDHDALAVLDACNPYGWVTGAALQRYTLTSLDFHGRSAWRLAFDRRGRPTEIYWLPPLSFTPVPDPNKPMRALGGIKVHEAGGVQTIPASEICYFSTDNPQDPLEGTSKIAVLRHPINLRAFSQGNNIDFFKNSMRPDWMLSGPFSNTEENTNRIRRAVRRMLSGANNRAPLILGEGMTAHLLTTSHEDAQWVEQQRLAQEEISAVFGVPLVYLNNLERMTYDNVRTAKLILWHDTMIPECDDRADVLNRRFLWRFWPDSQRRRIALGFDYAAIEGLGEDLALIWERVVGASKQLSEQVMHRELTPNQARAIRRQLFADLGLDTTPFESDVPGGDTFYDLFTNVPVDQLSVQAVMDIWAMRGSNPEFVEDVPGAPTAGQNAQQVADRLSTPSEPPPPGLPPPPAPGPPAPRPTPPEATPATPPEATSPAKGADPVDLAELRRQVAEDLRQSVEASVGAAAVKAFGEALAFLQSAPQAAHQADAVQLERRLKRVFQDQQTDALRAVRQAQAAGVPPPSDLYGRRVYEGRLAELIGDERARQVEAVTRAALRVAGPAGVASVFRAAIDHRAAALAQGRADPGAGPQRPLETQILAAEEHHAAEVRRALTSSLDAEGAASGWRAWSSAGKAGDATVSADLLTAAREFARGLGIDPGGLLRVLRAIYADGWRLGIGGALRQLTGRGMPAESADEAAAIDWAAWKPGNPGAERQAAGLADLLQRADVVIQGVDETTLDAIAQTLARGAAGGDSVDSIAGALRDIVDDDDRAQLIAHTELARAQSAASLDTYAGNGITGKGWLTFHPCPICAQNEGVEVPLDGAFPSGDQMPPAHPRCRCALIPVTLAAAAVTAAGPPPVRKEQLYATARHPEHDHSTDAGERPVIVLDLHGTITPSHGFTAPGQPGSMLPPFDGVREALDILAAGGCCIHIATAALSPTHAPDVLAARRRLIDAYTIEHGLPVSWVTGKVGAHVYYDDRMVSARQSWAEILAEVVERMALRFDVGPDGIWRRKDIPDVGADFEGPEPEDIGPDLSRGLSTPILDADLHRCLFEASSSKLSGPLKPGALEAVRAIYGAGFGVHLSCAGWDPTTHDPDDSARRLAAMRQQVRTLGVPYDEMVSKDHPDLAIDDKGIRHVDWATDLPLILAALGTPHPEDEVTPIREPEA